MDENAKEMLTELGLITAKDSVRPEHLATALRILKGSNAPDNKSRNRYTGPRETLAGAMAKELGKEKNYVTKEMAFWLARFRGKYDPFSPLFRSVCEPKMVEIITPWQLLYLISLKIPSNWLKGE